MGLEPHGVPDWRQQQATSHTRCPVGFPQAIGRTRNTRSALPLAVVINRSPLLARMLFRLSYAGSASRWGFAIYRASHDDYRQAALPDGWPSGTPEDALDTACGLYLGDPTAWRTNPHKTSGDTHQLGAGVLRPLLVLSAWAALGAALLVATAVRGRRSQAAAPIITSAG